MTSLLSFPDQRIDLPLTIQSGQFHRWERQGNSYVLIHQRVVARFEQGEDVLVVESYPSDITPWEMFFDQGTDYQDLRRPLRKETLLVEALAATEGLRILRQDPYETILAFLLSANNNMKRIQGSLEKMASRYGDFLGDYFGAERYALPSPEQLSSVSPSELRASCGVGYRDEALISFARGVCSGQYDLKVWDSLDDDILLNELLKMKGVGRKVAHCILLFAFHRMGAFPVDVWVARGMEELFPHCHQNRKQMEQYAQERFGDRAGYVQQILFIHARGRHKIVPIG